MDDRDAPPESTDRIVYHTVYTKSSGDESWRSLLRGLRARAPAPNSFVTNAPPRGGGARAPASSTSPAATRGRCDGGYPPRRRGARRPLGGTLEKPYYDLPELPEHVAFLPPAKPNRGPLAFNSCFESGNLASARRVVLKRRVAASARRGVGGGGSGVVASGVPGAVELSKDHSFGGKKSHLQGTWCGSKEKTAEGAKRGVIQIVGMTTPQTSPRHRADHTGATTLVTEESIGEMNADVEPTKFIITAIEEDKAGVPGTALSSEDKAGVPGITSSWIANPQEASSSSNSSKPNNHNFVAPNLQKCDSSLGAYGSAGGSSSQTDSSGTGSLASSYSRSGGIGAAALVATTSSSSNGEPSSQRGGGSSYPTPLEQEWSTTTSPVLKTQISSENDKRSPRSPRRTKQPFLSSGRGSSSSHPRDVPPRDVEHQSSSPRNLLVKGSTTSSSPPCGGSGSSSSQKAGGNSPTGVTPHAVNGFRKAEEYDADASSESSSAGEGCPSPSSSEGNPPEDEDCAGLKMINCREKNDDPSIDHVLGGPRHDDTRTTRTAQEERPPLSVLGAVVEDAGAAMFSPPKEEQNSSRSRSNLRGDKDLRPPSSRSTKNTHVYELLLSPDTHTYAVTK